MRLLLSQCEYFIPLKYSHEKIKYTAKKALLINYLRQNYLYSLLEYYLKLL